MHRTSTFSIGQLDLFITSHLASDLNLVSEVVYEADDENHYTLDGLEAVAAVEREPFDVVVIQADWDLHQAMEREARKAS